MELAGRRHQRIPRTARRLAVSIAVEKGHWAYKCRKSKREKGSCYACGKRGHFVAKCLKNKNKNEGENNYVRYVKINFVNESNTRLIAECLIDTESPISFTKISKVPKDISKSPVLSLYFGLNKSYQTNNES